MGGRPSKGTKRDKRLKENKPSKKQRPKTKRAWGGPTRASGQFPI
jgi:hypothetical protein